MYRSLCDAWRGGGASAGIDVGRTAAVCIPELLCGIGGRIALGAYTHTRCCVILVLIIATHTGMHTVVLGWACACH